MEEKLAELEAELIGLVNQENVLIRALRTAENNLKENQAIIASKKEYLEAMKVINAHDKYEETGCATGWKNQCNPVCVCYMEYGETGVLLKKEGK